MPRARRQSRRSHSLPRELDYLGVLSALQELLGQRVTVIISGPQAILSGDPQRPAARFRGALRRTQSWMPDGSFETIVLVGGDPRDEELTSWFALMPDTFIGAHRNDELQTITIVCSELAIIISSSPEDA